MEISKEEMRELGKDPELTKKVQIEVSVKFEGEVIDQREIDQEEIFMVEIWQAIRNGYSPAQALEFLADVGSRQYANEKTGHWKMSFFRINDPDKYCAECKRVRVSSKGEVCNNCQREIERSKEEVFRGYRFTELNL